MKPNIIITLIVGLAVGFAVGYAVSDQGGAQGDTLAALHRSPSQQPSRTPPAPSGPVYKVAVGDAPVRGPSDALVTIVEFADFQCPYCGRAYNTVKQVEREYEGQVRLAFKEFPLPARMHPFARGAALAALAAKAQGKFWPMFDLLYPNQRHLTSADLEKYAQEVGLDVAQWKKDMASPATAQALARDQAEGRQFGVTGTPTFFINGQELVGAQPIGKFRTVINQQIAKAKKLLASGTSKSHLYAKVIAAGLTRPAPTPSRNAAPSVVKVPIPADAPSFGPKNAKVTIVEFSDFQCPYCGRAAPAVEQIREAFPKDVHFVFRNFPLSMHRNSHLSARAGWAAYRQGKFWQMHDILFGNQREFTNRTQLTMDMLVGYAKEAGLDIAKFKQDLDSADTKAKIERDERDGQAVGVHGTPTFFIDGKRHLGGMPFPQFKSTIEAEIRRADKLLSSGVKPSELYEKMIGSAKGPTANARPVVAPSTVEHIDIGNAPIRGPRNAPVTIVEWSDFQCPYCGRAYGTVKALEAKYKGKVRVVYKNQPLPIHAYSHIAAEAAMAAKAQGKFWQMHDLLFTHQHALDRASLEKYASDLHLDMAAFRKALDTKAYAKEIAAESAQGHQVGANGTPTFFINGHRITGARPIGSFEQVIDQELAKVARK